jgi:hypothetical protein
MPASQLAVELLRPERADVYVAGGGSGLWQLVHELDKQGIRAVTADGDDTRVMSGCSAMVAMAETSPMDATVLNDVRRGASSRVPFVLIANRDERVRVEAGDLHIGPCDPIAVGDTPHIVARDVEEAVGWILPRVPAGTKSIPRYAYFIGRLERDFAQAREAVRTAIETEAGIACLWSDDSRYRSNVASVRERTRLLIREASFVVADLSLGPESPERENPSRAHEIGMAIGYDREILLCSQEPRRYPYFSVADMQMSFWLTEDELESIVAGWIRNNPHIVRQRVLNYELPDPHIPRPAFRFDPSRRFIGPNLKRRRWRGSVALGVVLTVATAIAAVVAAVG